MNEVIIHTLHVIWTQFSNNYIETFRTEQWNKMINYWILFIFEDPDRYVCEEQCWPPLTLSYPKTNSQARSQCLHITLSKIVIGWKYSLRVDSCDKWKESLGRFNETKYTEENRN